MLKKRRRPQPKVALVRDAAFEEIEDSLDVAIHGVGQYLTHLSPDHAHWSKAKEVKKMLTEMLQQEKMGWYPEK